MKVHSIMRKTMHLLLALVIALPGLIVGQDQAEAAGTEWRDITDNAPSGASSIAMDNEKLYLLDKMSRGIIVRGKDDSNWTTLTNLPNQIVVPIKLVVRGGDIYVLDQGIMDIMTSSNDSKIFKSSDNGQNWSVVSGPSGGYLAMNDSLQSMFFDTDGNFYAVSYEIISKRDTNGVWTKINALPDDSNFLHFYASAAVDSSGNLYATHLKVNKTIGASQTTVMYRYNGTSWVSNNVSRPGTAMKFTVDMDGNIHLAYEDGPNNVYLTSAKNIYMFDGTSFNMEATTDAANWTQNGIAFDGTYYYIAGSDGIRTTNPAFGMALTQPPTLTADSSDNDTGHAIDLTYTADSAWMSAITAVDISPSLPDVLADWTQPGKITITGLTTAGTYTVSVKAAGYMDATVSQTIVLKTPPTLMADSSDNDTGHAIELTFTDDAVWRAAITDVVVTKGGTAVNAVHTVGQGTLTLTGLAAGTYEVKIKASGYQDAVVNQEVNLVPSVWYDITSNLTLTVPPILWVDQAVYAAQFGTPGVYYRNPADMEWQTIDWSSGDFGAIFSFIARSGEWYAADVTTTGMMSPSTINVHISSNQGVTWDTYSLPSSYTFTGALNPLVISPSGAVYLNDGKTIFKMSENHSWSQIPVLPDSGGFSFAYTGLAVNASNELYANIRKYNPMQPLNHSAKLYKYNESTSQWVAIANSPSASMQLYTDSDGGMHAGTSIVLNGETPRAYLYRIDDTGFADEATLDGLEQARYGIAYGNGYYYILDADGKTIRTTHPNFFTGQTPPVLSPDLTDNDDLHPLELTFADNAAWRSNITSVTIKKGSTVVSEVYQFAPGVLKFPQALSAGTYLIEIEATGYKKATVEQTVRITAPVLVADTTNNDTANEITITFTDNEAWRSVVTSVAINGSAADNETYELSAGKLVFPAGILPVGDVEIVIQATGYPDASVTQTVTLPIKRSSDRSKSSSGSAAQGPEILKVDVFGGSRSGSVVSQIEIVRTTDEQGRKSDKVSFTSDLAAQAVEAMKSSGAAQAVIVIPDTKDEVAELQVSLPREALNQLTGSGIGLMIETQGVSIEIPTASLAASSGDLYFHIVPIKDAAEQQNAAERAKMNSASTASQDVIVVGRPMTIETNLQSQPVGLALPIGSYPAGQADRLRIYIEHSDGTTEWLKGELTTDISGGAAIRFHVTKFSTFVVVDTGAAVSTELPEAYMFGYEDGTFRPAQQVTRGQLAAILSRLYGSTVTNSSNQSDSYQDEAQFPSWAADNISRVSALGLMDGYEDGTFRAGRAVTRAEAATIIARLVKQNHAGESVSFTDTDGHWASASIAAAAQAGLVSGYEDGSFAPERELSRAEAVILFNRLIGLSSQSNQAPKWSDVPQTHWAFGDIQAASSTIEP